MAEGAELIRCALESGASVESVYVSPEGDHDGATQEVCRRAGAAGARVFLLGPAVLERVADTVTPQPVVAVLPMLEDAGAASGGPVPGPGGEGSLVVVLVDVRDPGNAGTALRSADASGAARVVFAGESVDPYNPKTVRASAGSLFHIPFSVRSDPSVVATELAAEGFRTLGAVVHGGEDYAAVDWSVPTAVFLGNEAAGLDPALSPVLSGKVGIPMSGRAESLNVGVACAVVCFEAFRQRRAQPRSIPGDPW